MKNKDQRTLSLPHYLAEVGEDISTVSTYSITNLFNVVIKGNLSYYNLSKTFNFLNLDKMDTSNYSEYAVKEKDTWTNISFNQYGTINAWWIICKFNKIKNPFEKLKTGTIIKLPSDEIIQKVITYIS